MSFESCVIAFADRFLSDRTFELVIAPALADLQFDLDAGGRHRIASRIAVLNAVAGGLRLEVWRDSGTLFKVALLSACYYSFPLAVGIRYFKTWPEFFVAITFVLALSLVPVLVCFWPERRTAPPVD
jgi:hypothetical protein